MMQAFRLRQVVRQMWFLPALFSVAALLTVAAAHYSAFLLPQDLPVDVSQSAIEDILTIIGSSMLAVATFALATMVNAFASATQTTSPRAVHLIAEDRTAQTAISVFVGAFLFAVVGIIALSGGFYSASGRLILFAATIVVVIIVVGALVRWINKISSIGQVGETIERVEVATTAAFRELAQSPLFGCCRTMAAPDGTPVHADRVSFVQHVTPAFLQKLAEERDLQIHVAARPGTYATAAQPLVIVNGMVDDAVERRVRKAFVLGRNRTFDHDPVFGLIVLSEIASRALSPGINDPGTAINVLHTQVRVLDTWVRATDAVEPEPDLDRVSMMPLTPDTILTSALRPIARDGAGNVEVCLKLYETLAAIGAMSPPRFGPVIATMGTDVLARARAEMSHPADLHAVERAANGLMHRHGHQGQQPEP